MATRPTDNTDEIPIRSRKTAGDTTMSSKTESNPKMKSSATRPTLSQEVLDLVQELRDTVRRIDPKRHTPTSLRRTLVNVSSILEDIGAANTPKPSNGATEANP